MQYVAKFFKDDDGIGVEFPDVPGAFTCADTMSEAKEMAKEALDGVLQSMYERHDPLPVAKTAPNVEEGLVPIDVDDGLAVAYSIFEAYRGKSAASVARTMGISRQAFRYIENAKLSLSKLVKVADALDKHVEIQFVDNYDCSSLERKMNVQCEVRESRIKPRSRTRKNKPVGV